MVATLAELAELVGGKLHGDGQTAVREVAPLHLVGEEELTFVTDAERCKELQNTAARAVVIPDCVCPEAAALPSIQVADVHDAIARIVCHFRPPREQCRVGVSPQAIISDSAQIDETADVHPLASVGDDVIIEAGVVVHSGARIMAGCRIGENTKIYPNAVLYENCVVGPRCVVHACAAIGAYGFGYDSSCDGHEISHQLGFVILESDVEIGANSTVDRGTYGPTIVGEGTKVDNQVMIAHNCRIGKHNLLCAHTGIAGSTTTGDFVVMAGRVGVRDHVHIGDRAVLGAMAGIMSDVPKDARWVGIPATPEREQMVKQVALARLPQMRKEFKEMAERIAALEKTLE